MKKSEKEGEDEEEMMEERGKGLDVSNEVLQYIDAENCIIDGKVK